MESDSDDRSSVIWSKHDQCMAKWSGDGEFYAAVIQGFQMDKKGEKIALVSFEGFGKEDNEFVDLCNLKKDIHQNVKNDLVCLGTTDEANVQTMSFVTDLEQEQDRLNAKYSLLEKEEKYMRKGGTIKNKLEREEDWNSTIQHVNEKAVIKCSGKVKQNKKVVVATGGEVKEKNTLSEKKYIQKGEAEQEKADEESNNVTTAVKKHPRIPTGLTSSESEEDDANKTLSGFSDLEMEKPYFPNINPPCKKEPFLLSTPGKKPVIQVPSTMNQYLRDYQKEGISFLYKHYVKGHGAILADDMGLGKTIQVIGFISAVMGKTGTKIDVMKQKPKFIRQLSEHADLYDEDRAKKPFLIIGPASVLHNWVDELETWGHFTVGKYHKNFKNQTVADLEKNKLDVVVTTFETCRDHIDTMNNFAWDAVIADEAHKIKGLKAEVTQALRKLKCKKRFGLTGTPLQNKLEEFWCILDWASPNCLGDVKTFKNKVCKVIQKGQKQEATKRELAQSRCVQDQFAKIKEKWMLRRTKKLIVNQLPKKEELIIYCKPTVLQSDIYKTIMSQPDMHYILRQNDPCDCGRDAPRARCCYKKTPEGKSIKSLTFTYLHLLLKTANHIALLLPQSTESDVQRKYAREICDRVFEEHPQFLQQTRQASFRTLSDPQHCGKMKLLTGLLSVFKKKRSKIILFSLSTRLLDIIEEYVIGKGYEYRRLDGQTPDHKRMGIIKEFNKDPSLFLFLVSTKAGGVGLNLTGANVVIIFDPNWNPTHDLQAQDRAYRLGQTRDVKVYRLVTSGTIEETIYLRQIHKQQQANIAVEGENAKRYFHKDELFGITNLFLMRESDRCLTEDILKRNRRVEEGLKGYKVENYLLSTPESDSNDHSDGTHNDSESIGSDNSDESDCSSSLIDDISAKDSTGRSSKAQPIMCSSDSSEQEYPHNTEMQVKHALSSNKAPNDIGGFHDSQVPSTSCIKYPTKTTSVKQHNVINHKPNDDLEDLWNSFEKVDEPLKTARSNNNSKHSKTSVKVKRRTKNPSVDFNVSTAVMFESIDKRLRNEKPRKATNRNVGKSPQSKKKNSNKGFINSETSNTSDENGSEEETAYRQKSSRLTNKKKKSLRPKAILNSTLESVTDVLENCGVIHTHQNQKIIGPSRAEDHMTKCAIKDVFEKHLYTQAPAMDCDPFSSSSEESDDIGAMQKQKRKKSNETSTTVIKKKHKKSERMEQENVEDETPTSKRKKISGQKSGPWSKVIGNKNVLVGQTPKGIRKQQLAAMAIFFDTDPVLLAKQLVYSEPTERLQLLKTFYENQDPELNQVVCTMEEQRQTQENESVKQKKKPAPGVSRKQTNAKKVKTRKRLKTHENKSVRRTKGYNYTDNSSDTDGVLRCTTSQTNKIHRGNEKVTPINTKNMKNVVTTATDIKSKQTIAVNEKRKGLNERSVDKGAISSVIESSDELDLVDNPTSIRKSQNCSSLNFTEKNDSTNTTDSISCSKTKLGRLLRQPTLDGENINSYDGYSENTEPMEDEKLDKHKVTSSDSASDMESDTKENTKTVEKKNKHQHSDDFLDDLFF